MPISRFKVFKEFKSYVTGVTDRIRDDVEAWAEAAGVKVVYVNDSSRSKEELAADLAKQAGRTTGLRAILSAIEPCRTFFVRKNPATGLLELQNRPGKCRSSARGRSCLGRCRTSFATR